MEPRNQGLDLEISCYLRKLFFLKKDFSESFVKLIIVDERYIVRVSETVSSIGHKLTVL